MTRRVFLTSLPQFPRVVRKTEIQQPTPASNHNNMETDTLYTFESDRFRSLYMVAQPEPSCFVVRRRVDWYDPIEEESKSFVESVMYITDTAGES